MLSFTFDDGWIGQRMIAADLLKAYDLKATAFDYVASLSQGSNFMNVTQLEELRDSYGWEVGGHTYTHPHMSNLTGEDLQREVVGSKSEFAKLGFDLQTFAYPYSEGSQNVTVTQLVRENYAGARSSGTIGTALLYDGSADIYDVVANNVVNTTRPEVVNGWIDEAASQRKWLILSFHQIVPNKTAFDTFYRQSDLDTIASYAHGKLVHGTLEVVTFDNGTETISNISSALALLPSLNTANLWLIVAIGTVFFGSTEAFRRWRATMGKARLSVQVCLG